ncbi:MAG: bifunctional folylpolyglutamate synthase/dihydrofolate synthase [Desulfobacterota bacterium]|nr:bifunctional folylpolyglutamate synthase/dihydrofolate synthase [Thermodesulfobacteriota bacterium]
MNYDKAVNYLYNLQRFGIKLGLHTITRLLAALGNPHRKLRCIHVAGTNGKGSTCVMIEAVLRNAGYRPGLYTSPHLSDFSERIQICRKPIAHNRIAALVGDIKRLCERKSLATVTFFEFATALAFLYFYEEAAEPVVVETGLGGRYDATNVIDPLLSVITSISRDHQQYLGKTLREIAAEKAGIIKPKKPLITDAQRTEVREVLARVCFAQGSSLYRLGRDIHIRTTAYPLFSYNGIQWQLKELRCGLAGPHQIRNAALALCATELIHNAGYSINEDHARSGVANAFWPCRFEVLQQEPYVIVDGAHNPAACRILLTTLAYEFPRQRRIMVIGIMGDKDIKTMLALLTHDAYATIVCRPEIERAASRETFEKHIEFSPSNRVFWHETSRAALDHALQMACPRDVICVTGSLFLAGEIRERYREKCPTAGRRIGM